MTAQLIASMMCTLARLITGVRPVWLCTPEPEKQRIYFANHRSHGDFLLIWAALPKHLRTRTRPVAGADYWLAGPMRRFISEKIFRAVLINRKVSRSTGNPVELMRSVLDKGDSLILFPEGTRHHGDGLLPFKSGLFHLTKSNPEVEFIPVWIENLGRVMPKGAFIPAPLLCTMTFGPAIVLQEDEKRDDFLVRANATLLDLAPSS